MFIQLRYKFVLANGIISDFNQISRNNLALMKLTHLNWNVWK